MQSHSAAAWASSPLTIVHLAYVQLLKVNVASFSGHGSLPDDGLMLWPSESRRSKAVVSPQAELASGAVKNTI